MENRPVIILGGGLLGSLLALRLQEAQPEVPFKIYEESSRLGGFNYCGFDETDIGEAIKWIAPLSSYSWSSHTFRSKNSELSTEISHYLLRGEDLHQEILKRLRPSSIRLNNSLSIEAALREGSFVIDTRKTFLSKNYAFKKTMSVEVELENSHHIINPITSASQVRHRSSPQSLTFYPLGPVNIVMIQNYLINKEKLDVELMRKNLLADLPSSWKVKKIYSEKIENIIIPISSPIIYEGSRIISLSDVFHDNTGCPLPFATQLIDKMVNTSVRFGEVKEVVKKFRSGLEKNRAFLRFINKLILEKKIDSSSNFVNKINFAPGELRTKMRRGNLSLLDRLKILGGELSFLNYKSLVSDPYCQKNRQWELHDFS